MRTDFSPTAMAARLAARHEADRPAASHPVATETVNNSRNVTEQLWCEWPRRKPATAPRRTGIWQALREIQTHHHA